MSDSILLVSDISRNVGKLIEELKQIRKELIVLRSKYKLVVEDNDRLKEQIALKSVQDAALVISEKLSLSGDILQTRNKINELIRQIDKSISLLQE